MSKIKLARSPCCNVLKEDVWAEKAPVKTDAAGRHNLSKAKELSYPTSWEVVKAPLAVPVPSSVAVQVIVTPPEAGQVVGKVPALL